MASRFLSNININDEYTLPSADGSADQIIKTDGAGQLSFVDQSTINAGNAEHVVIYAKNTSGASISKGTPVYITGTVGATDTVEIAPADAGNSAKMPAVGLLDDTLANNAFGYVITGGFMDNITTDPIDGSTPSSNDTVYVKAGGGLTLTKPTGSSNLIQNVAKVGKVSGGNSGSLIVSSILRTNDVPNLTTGKIWVGTANNTTESTVVHLDETNSYMGVGTNNPTQELDVNGNLRLGTTGDFYISQSPFTTSTFYIRTATSGTVAFGAPASFQQNVTAQGDIYAAGGSSSTAIGTKRFGNWSNKIVDTGNNYFNLQGGNFGIGTSSPSSKLQVNGDLTVGDDSTIGSWINVIAAGSNQDAGIRFGSETNTDSKAAIYTNTSNSDLHFDVTESTRMLIDSGTGNVGIGTSSPGSKLDVSGGDIRLSTNATYLRSKDSASAIPRVLGMNSANAFYVGPIDTYAGGPIVYGASSNLTYHGFYGGGSEKVRITSGGNVGIGTTSPAYKLDVDGEVRVGDNQKLKLWDDPFGAIITPLNAHLALTTTRTQDNIYFDPGNSTKMIIEGGGNVGIGANSPSTKLHVLGTSSSMPSLGAAPTAAQIGGSSYGTLFSTLTSGRGVIQQGRSDGAAVSYDLLLQPVGGNVAIGKTSAGVKLDVAGDVRVNGLDNFLYTTNTNDIYTFSSSTQTMANAPNGYLWHDLLAFNYVYTTTQEVTSDGTNWSSTTLQKDLFAQKEGQAITVIGSTQTGVRWTFNNTAWGSAVLLNVAFTYVASDINKNILVESSSNGTSWTTRFTNTATAGTSTKTCKLTSYGGDSYVRVTITKAVSSSNLVRMSQLRLMTLRAGDQGYGREYHLPITWDGDRNIGIKLASPTTSISEALEVNGSVKATADTDAYKGYIKSVITTGYSMKSASTLYQYIPYNSYTLTTLQAYYNRTVAAYNGRVKKIIVKRIDGASADATGMKFKKEINGTVIATEYTATVLSGSGNFQATYNFANSDFTFSAGDSIGILMQSSGGTGMIGAGAIQIVLEYNIT